MTDVMGARERELAPLLSLAAGYAGPLLTSRAAFGPAGRRRSLKECRFALARAS